MGAGETSFDETEAHGPAVLADVRSRDGRPEQVTADSDCTPMAIDVRKLDPFG